MFNLDDRFYSDDDLQFVKIRDFRKPNLRTLVDIEEALGHERMVDFSVLSNQASVKDSIHGWKIYMDYI